MPSIGRLLAQSFLVIALITVSLLTFSHVQAYRDLNATKMPGSASLLYVFYDHLNSGLGIANSGTHSVHALNQWNLASAYSLFDILISGPINRTSDTIRAVNFQAGYSTLCGNLNTISSSVPAATCNPEKNIYLNSNANFKWNTSGIHGSYIYDGACLCNRRNTDYLTVVLHELGHLWNLDHPALGNPVMDPDWTTKQTLDEDDKRGATQNYAPYTGWETALTLSWFPGYTYSQVQGHSNVVLYQVNTTSPSLEPVASEAGVTPYSGSRYLRLRSNAYILLKYRAATKLR